VGSNSFNPYRVFKFVATDCHGNDRIEFYEFQSLSGFQVRCNAMMKRPENRLREVSIPIGFSSSLQRLRSNWIQNQSQSFNPYRVFKFVATLNPFAYPFLRHVVSIPIGFSSSLQLENPVHGRIISFSFNPYRVFKFVATFWLSSVHSGY